MRILHLATYDQRGGACRASYRIHQSLIGQGTDSKLLVQHKEGSERSVLEASSPVPRFLKTRRASLDQIWTKLYPHRKSHFFHSAWLPMSGIQKAIDQLLPDIVHLHWVTGGFLRIEEMKNWRRPVVWTLHDMWPLTGGCHYPETCRAFLNQCGSCPFLGSRNDTDLSHKNFNRKKKAYFGLNSLNFVSVSHWLTSQVRQSPLLNGRTIHTIPNAIDCNFFKPLCKQECRQNLGLSTSQMILAFGADKHSISSARKGGDFLYRALNRLDQKNFTLLVFGTRNTFLGEPPQFPILYLGDCSDEKLRMIYNAADMVLVPSREETFGLVAAEASACGTSVVASAGTGLAEIVEHKKTGYLFEKENERDFQCGIDWIRKQSPTELRKAARSLALTRFSYPAVAQQLLRLYESLLLKGENHGSNPDGPAKRLDPGAQRAI